jgi:DNA-binding GntR family transcriptional regulator
MEQDTIQKQESLRDQVLSILKSRVIVGQFKPGEIYSSTNIAQELGVSSSPVREALLALVDLGLMESVRNRGFRVVDVSETTRNEIVNIRTMLEVPAVINLVSHREKLLQRKDKIEAYLHQIEACAHKNDLIGYLAADRGFHLSLLEVLGNQRLNGLVNVLRDQTLLVGLSKLYATGELLQEAFSHRRIYEAILAGDREQVGTLMLEHMRANAGPDYRAAPVHIVVGAD